VTIKLLKVEQDRLNLNLLRVEVEVTEKGWAGSPARVVKGAMVQDGEGWRIEESGVRVISEWAEEVDRQLWLRDREEQRKRQAELARDRRAVEALCKLPNTRPTLPPELSVADGPAQDEMKVLKRDPHGRPTLVEVPTSAADVERARELVGGIVVDDPPLWPVGRRASRTPPRWCCGGRCSWRWSRHTWIRRSAASGVD
jgi:hypothetical protein